jgi:hypothetical protein
VLRLRGAERRCGCILLQPLHDNSSSVATSDASGAGAEAVALQCRACGGQASITRSPAAPCLHSEPV